MPKQYYTAERLNEEIDKIRQKGFTIPTTKYYIQEGHTRIVIGNDLKNAGYIRTYEQAVDYLKRVYGDRYVDYTPEMYEFDIKSLQDVLGSERTYHGEIRHQRAQLLNIISDMNRELGTKFSAKGLRTDELYNAVKTANEMVKDSNANSPMFYEYLSDILEGLSDSV